VIEGLRVAGIPVERIHDDADPRTCVIGGRCAMWEGRAHGYLLPA
jgi:hypothetical protein